MMDYNTPDVLPSSWKDDNAAKIKVIGVGGGGCNAVTYMFNQGIKGCEFIVCNTDSQSLRSSSVQNRLQLGKSRELWQIILLSWDMTSIMWAAA